MEGWKVTREELATGLMDKLQDAHDAGRPINEVVEWIETLLAAARAEGAREERKACATLCKETSLAVSKRADAVDVCIGLAARIESRVQEVADGR